ncbi:MAG: non-heme iron oxygenase ferredoxin subunit [Actinobacteria bacterium]|nr:non-heme iron oxygenase ferredoxin subunit [Actinomycetota bacterium]
MVRLCALDELVPDRARRFEVEGRHIAVARIDDDVYAIGDFCSHAMVSLSEGDVLTDSCELECWKHGAAFSLRTGEPSGLPATRPVPVYRVTVVDGDVHLDPEELPR